jgi:nucleoside-diphosphate-sugar epimerase
MKVIIVGGAGFLGSYIADTLVEYDITIYDISKNKNHKTIVGNVLDLNLLTSSFYGFDAVIHTAALTSSIAGTNEDIFQINSIGTFNVHEAARRNGITKVISTSSETVYGFFMQNVSLHNIPKEMPINETYLTNPKDIYALSKVIGENIAKFYACNYGMNTAVIRPPWIVSPKDYVVHHGFINGGKSGGGGVNLLSHLIVLILMLG